MSDYGRLCDAIESAGYSKEGWATEGDYFDNYAVSQIINDMNPNAEKDYSKDKYMQLSFNCARLIEQINSLYLGECLYKNNPDSAISNIVSLINKDHW
mgnify:CR=1 FL=1